VASWRREAGARELTELKSSERRGGREREEGSITCERRDATRGGSAGREQADKNST
jgi:hypothetical protein